MMSLCAFCTHNFKILSRRILLVFCCSFFINIAFAGSFSVVTNIEIIGNKITKRKIILRELPFKVGDTIQKAAAQAIYQQAKDNLMNTSLFNFVTINPLSLDSIHTKIFITVTERWYIWPIPVFYIEDSNFNTWLRSRDLTRIDYGLRLEIHNFRGRMEQLAFQAQLGYTSGFSVFYSKPYLNKKQNLGLAAQITMTENHQITYNSSNDKRIYYSKNSHYVEKESSAAVQLQYRNRLYNHQYLTVSFQNVNVDDSVLILNPFYLGNKSSCNFFTLSYRFKHDRRDFANYPLMGHFLSFKITKDGLGLFNNSVDEWEFRGEAKKFFKLPAHFYLSGGAEGEYTQSNKKIYYLSPKLGYSDYVRSYEYYIIAGQSWFIGKVQLRYGLLNKKTFQFHFLKSSKFNRFPLSVYPGIFYDFGEMWDNSNRHNPLANKLIYGEGLSLDFVTYYNIVLRLEYSVNRAGQAGLFVHFVAPI